MSVTKAPTLRKLPGRMTLAAIAEKGSTGLSQAEEVGMKWM